MNLSIAADQMAIAALGNPDFIRWIRSGVKKHRDRTAKLNEAAEKRERQR